MLVICFCDILQIFSIPQSENKCLYLLTTCLAAQGWKEVRVRHLQSPTLSHCSECPPSAEINQQNCCFNKCADCLN